MTRHLLMDRFDQTECGLPVAVVPKPEAGAAVDCDYCLNGINHPQAKDYDDYHRAQLAAFARAARSRVDSSDAPPRSDPATKGRGLAASDADLATLRAWSERLKYASRSAVADFHPGELAEIAGALERLLK